MNSAIGVLGAFLIAIGGVMISLSLGAFIQGSSINFGHIIANFSGFLLFGLGLWLIVQSGKKENKPQ